MQTGKSNSLSIDKDLKSRFALLAADSLVWILSIFVAVMLRYEFNIHEPKWPTVAIFMGLAVVLQFVFGEARRIYSPRNPFSLGKIEDVINVSIAIGATGLLLWAATLGLGAQIQISRGFMLIATFIAIVLALALRLLVRRLIEHRRRPSKVSSKALILGGGYIGTNLVQWMMSDPASPYLPVGFIDDDPRMRSRKIMGIPVLGGFRDIPEVAEDSSADILIVAIGNVDAAKLRKIHDVASGCGLCIKVMPPIGQVVAKGVRGGDLRDLSIEDLLGRQPVETNVSEIAGYLTGKKVLVTGAGGSIGSQLCVEIAKYGPSELMMLDRDETGLQQTQIAVVGNGLLDSDSAILADIRDEHQICEIFAERQPEVVFHAAALKHLPLLEKFPEEGWKTNVIGTQNVLKASANVNVATFVNISTDKAANPTSVLGHSKKLAEEITAWYGGYTGNRYLSVRFGNVIGSRGSMLPTFLKLIQEDKALTVTHPDVTRYFMTIPEACQLVLQAGGIGNRGEVLILDMGDPVRILDIAQRMIKMSGKDIDIVFTGLRKGEKMHEELIGDGEKANRPLHPKVSHAQAGRVNPNSLDYDEFCLIVGKIHPVQLEDGPRT